VLDNTSLAVRIQHSTSRRRTPRRRGPRPAQRAPDRLDVQAQTAGDLLLRNSFDLVHVTDFCPLRHSDHLLAPTGLRLREVDADFVLRIRKRGLDQGWEGSLFSVPSTSHAPLFWNLGGGRQRPAARGAEAHRAEEEAVRGRWPAATGSEPDEVERAPQARVGSGCAGLPSVPRADDGGGGHRGSCGDRAVPGAHRAGHGAWARTRPPGGR